MKRQECRKLHLGLIALSACERRIGEAINLAEKDKGNLPPELYGQIRNLDSLYLRITDTIKEYKQRAGKDLKNVINRRL